VSVHVVSPMDIARSTIPQDRSGHLAIVSGDSRASLGQNQCLPAKTTMLYSDIFALIILFNCGVLVSFPLQISWTEVACHGRLPMSAVNHNVFGSTHDVNGYNMLIHIEIANTRAFESFWHSSGVLMR
jgi:hypothetical protein